jgi:hypothetical protein
MKKVIGLSGRSEVGKTETLNLLIDLLEVKTTGCSMPTPQQKGKDRRMTFSYKGQIISICTAGDNKNELEKNLIYFNDNKSDIAISATRTRQATHYALNNLAESNGITVNWIRKIYDLPNEKIVNEKQAHQILDMI